MKPREFHIWQFPENKVRVLFKNHREFVNNTTKFFGSQKALANFLNIPPTHIYQWKKYPLYIPFIHIKKIVNKCKLDWYNVEKDIVSYKGINTSKPIIKPKLPIKETPEILALITHIICDGSVNKNGIPYYINSNKTLIGNFDEMLKNSFGEVNNKLRFGAGSNKNCYEYRFSKIIVELLEHFYQLKLYRAEKLPSVIFDLPREFSVSVIKAFADDEGTVDSSRRIGICSNSKELLQTLVDLLEKKFSFNNVTNILRKGEGHYYFYIKVGDIEKYDKEIGFNHPLKKQKLKELIELKINGRGTGQHTKVGETKENLLNLLNDNVLSTYDIIKELKINKSNVNMQIKRLLNEGLVVQDCKIGQTIFWTRRK